MREGGRLCSKRMNEVEKKIGVWWSNMNKIK